MTEKITVGKSDMFGPEVRTISSVPKEPVLAEHYHALTWTDMEMDALRRERCLCLRCDHMRIDPETGKPQANHCPFAERLYSVCVEADAATMTTRCGYYRPKVLKT